MLKLIKAPVKGYAEENQDNDVKFAFATLSDGVVTELFSGVKCRDFLGDCLWGEETKQVASIWSFTYDHTKQKLDRDKLRMIVSTSKDNRKYLDQIVKNFDLLKPIESFHNLEASTVQQLDDTNLLVEASSKWLLTTYLISYYTYLIKVASYSYKDVQNWHKELLSMENKEARYLKQTDKDLVRFSQNLFNICEPYKGTVGIDKTGIGEVHARTGFVSICTKQSKSQYAEKFAKL